MSAIKLGIRLESLNLPLRRGLQEAERLGVGGVQVDAVGDLAPSQLSQTGRREFRHRLRTHNLELTALGCPLRHGLDVPTGLDARIEHIRAVMALAYDLGPRRVIIQAGRIPSDPASAGWQLLREVVLALGQYGDRVGTTLALETGLEPGTDLAAFLRPLDTGSLGVNLDPANLLINGFDPYESTRALAGRIVHAHAHDARRAAVNRAAQEVPLGHGDIDWMAWLGILEDIEYRGWLVVEREQGSNGLADVAAGVSFLRRFLR
ncbi:MAG: sugar phosphate isomerase/epimerase [Gemmataceae bacterium]|nr:sugar phosphate isomerase/epimerase [Gemmataceae bacterium]MDW8265478.1 sugar phosphate isomerase/epimerase family protein [Gemmataceae bacterium]